MAIGSGGKLDPQPSVDAVLILGIPRVLMVPNCVPAGFFWWLAIWIVSGGGGFNVFFVVALVLSTQVVLLARVGATVGPEGIQVRRFFGRSRWVTWEEVENFLVESAPAQTAWPGQRSRGLYMQTSSEELVQIVGLPSWRYRRRNYRSAGRLLDRRLTNELLADLRCRLEHHKARGGGAG